MLVSLSWGDDQGDTRERSQCSGAVGSIQFPQLLSFVFPTVVGFYGVGPYRPLRTHGHNPCYMQAGTV